MQKIYPRLNRRNNAGNVFFLARSPLAPKTTTVKHNFLGTLHCTLSRSEAERSEGIGGPSTFRDSFTSSFDVILAIRNCDEQKHSWSECLPTVHPSLQHDQDWAETLMYSHVPQLVHTGMHYRCCMTTVYGTVQLQDCHLIRSSVHGAT